MHRLTGDAGDQVTRANASLEGGAIDQYVHHDSASAARDAQLRGLFVCQVLWHQPEPAAHDVTVSDNLLHDAAHEINRDRKADSFRAAVGAVQHGGVDADQLAVRVDQRTPGVA